MKDNPKTNRVSRFRLPNQRPTIGFLLTMLTEAYGVSLWTGAIDGARAGDANLICCLGRQFSDPHGFEAQANVLYDLVGAENVDGLVIGSSPLSNFMGLEGLKEFCARYRPLPMASLGVPLDGIPSLTVENHQGMREMVVHLIEAHGCRRIAFISGPPKNPEAEVRYRAYADALAEYGLPLDPALVSPPTDWLEASGREAVSVLLDERGLQPGAGFEAVVASNDEVALGVLVELQTRAIHVPEDVVVTGFDGLEKGEYCTPPLTSVRQPVYEQAYQAVEMVLAQLRGEEVPSQIRLPTELVLRQSCGCPDPVVVQAAAGPTECSLKKMAAGEIFPNTLAARREYICAEMIKAAGTTTEGIDPEWAEELLETFASDVQGKSTGAFLSALGRVTRQVVMMNRDVKMWQGVLSAHRRQVLPHLVEKEHLYRAEDLWQQARVMIAQATYRVRAYRESQASQQAERLRQVSQTLITTFDLATSTKVLAESLPELGIPGCYLALYEDPERPETWSNLIFAYNEYGCIEIPPGGLRFPSRQLAPQHLLPAHRPFSVVVLPLYFRKQHLGLLFLETGPQDGTIYESLRGQISGLLQGTLLMQQVQNHAAQLEQRVAERTEELTQVVGQLRTEGAERQQAQEALAHERNLLRTLVDSIPDFIFAKDIEGRFTLKNKADARTMGAGSPSEAIGKTDFDYYPSEIAERFFADDQQVIQSGEPLINREELNIDFEGNERWILTTKVPLRDGQGIVIGLVGMGRDITKRKQTEEALHQSEGRAREFQEKLKALHEVSLELVATQSIESLCIKAIELGHSILGFDRLGLLLVEGENLVSRFGIESSGELRVERGMGYIVQDDTLVMSSGLLTNREAAFVSEDADLRNFETVVGHGWNVVTGIWEGNTSIGWLAADNLFEQKPLIPYQVELLRLYGLTIGHLVTRKRAEAEVHRLNEELEQRVIARTQELQEANEEIRKFAYIVSHDLRAPLVNLKGFASELRSSLGVVMDGCDELLPLVGPTKQNKLQRALQEDIPEALRFIESSVNSMDMFTKAILKLSRLGRLSLEPVEVDTRSLVEKTLQALAYQINQRGVSVTIGDLPVVFADLISMEQIFGNILTNAVTYLDPNRPGEIEISAECDADETLFRIHDNGRGIAEEDMDKVFAPFRRAGRQDIPGEGMGLAYVQALVRRHGGRIWCESEAGVGTTFTFTIPRNLINDTGGS